MNNKKKDMSEWAGAGINGAPSFQGVAYGYGGRAQLAGPPRALPDDFEQVIDDLVADELQDLFGGQQAIFTERNQSDANYRDLPGFPATNTLVAKRGFVPVDPAEVNNVDFLGPTVGGIALKDIPGNTANNWKATTPEKRGKQTIDINALVMDQQLPEGIGSFWNPDQLVAPRDWQQEIEQNATGDMEAHNPVGGMGVLHKPVMFVPDSAENQVNMTRETVKRTVITPKESKMSSQKLAETIKKMVKEELGSLEEAEQIASGDALAWQKQALDAILKTHGGDYAKASQSPEWKAQLQQTATMAANNKASQVTGLPLPFETGPELGSRPTTQQRLQAMKPSVKTAMNTTQAEKAAQAQAAEKARRDAALRAKVVGLRGQANTLRADMSVPSSEAAEELVLYITSDGEIYEKLIKPAIKNLRRKVLKGTYDPALAPRMWLLVATVSAQKYAREFGMEKWHEHFNLSTRKEAAQDLTQHFEGIVKGEE